MTSDYYQLLHVAPDAPEPVIKASYRAMMQKLRHHPDLGGDPDMAQRLNEAVDVLCDPLRRAQYDESRSHRQAAGKHRARAEDPCASAGGTPRPSPRGDDPRSTDRQPASAGTADDGTGDAGRQSDHCTASACNEQSAASDTRHGHHAHSSSRSCGGHQSVDPAAAPLPRRARCLFCGADHADAAPQRQRPGLGPSAYGSNHTLASTSRSTVSPYGTTSHCLRCDAPLQRVEELAPSLDRELRRMQRYRLNATVTVWTAWPKDKGVAATLADLSIVGCAIHCHRRLADGATVLLEAPMFGAVCRVRYSRSEPADGRYLSGLEFLTLSMKARPGTVLSTVA